MAETTTAITEVPGHAEPDFLHNPETWVYLSITVFLLLAVFVAKAPQLIAKALDDRIAAVRRQLDEAKAIRAEAEALLKGAQASRDAATKDAEAIIARAHSEANELVAETENAARLTIERRTAAATAKIAAAERAAEGDLRAEVARRVTAAAAALIAAKADAGVQAKLADDAIAGLERRLH